MNDQPTHSNSGLKPTAPVRDDYLLGSQRIHRLAITVIMAIAAFLRWYRLDNCTLASGDEWLAIGPTFQFLEKFFRNPITAIGLIRFL